MKIKIIESFRSKKYGVMSAGETRTVDKADGRAWVASGKAVEDKTPKGETVETEESSHE